MKGKQDLAMPPNLGIMFHQPKFGRKVNWLLLSSFTNWRKWLLLFCSTQVLLSLFDWRRTIYSANGLLIKEFEPSYAGKGSGSAIANLLREILACVASVSNRVIGRKLERKQKKGSFVLLPLPRHSCFFCSCPSFLDEPREETLATQAREILVMYV